MDNLHIYVCGKTGSGKSAFMKSEAFRDIWKRDRTVVFLDPHGPDAYDLADAIPNSDVKRTVLLDFSDLNFPVAFDPLAYGSHSVLSGLKAIWLNDWGPRMHSILRHTLMLLECNRLPVSKIPRVLSDAAYRTRLLPKATPYVRRWFNTTFAKEYLQHRDHPFVPILNKVEEITATGLDKFLCAENPKLDFGKLLNDRAILIVNLAQKLGEERAAIAGAMVTSTLRAALLQNPTPCTLYADEFQTYGTTQYASMLSEMRKFGLQMCLAHQFTHQIPELLQKAILGNVQRRVIYTVDYEDAAILAKPYNNVQMRTDLTTTLATLPPFTAYDNGLRVEMPAFAEAKGRLGQVRAHARRHFAS